MAHYQVILAYDGTLFQGYQRQAKARTVQAVVEAALRKLGWNGQAILSAGRTDTGVHAIGQVIAFTLEWAHNVNELHQAMNANLPEDVAVRQVGEVDPQFHPRYQALARQYRYRVYCQEFRDPFKDRYAWRIWPRLEISSLQAAAQEMVGTHDFAAFGSPMRSGGSTVRTVISAGWQQSGSELVFEICANAFLYHMVRRLVFIQVQIGSGRLPVAALRDSLAGKTVLPSGIAPAQGLFLWDVRYPKGTMD